MSISNQKRGGEACVERVQRLYQGEKYEAPSNSREVENSKKYRSDDDRLPRFS